MPRTKRKDKSRVVLRTGESQRADGTYHFSWTDANHKRRYVYAKTLDELRYKEEQIAKDKSDGIKAEARYTTVNDIYELWKDLKRGLLVLAAYENDELFGIIRVVGDGFTIIFVQDILVFPREQRNGVGTALMKAVLDRYPDVRQIELATDNTSKTVAFYKSLGFTEFSEMGCCGFMRC